MPSKRYIHLPTKEPHCSEGWQKIRQDIRSALAREVKHVHYHAKQIHSWDTIYTGTLGVALMNYRLAMLSEKSPNIDVLSDSPSLITEAHKMISAVLRYFPLTCSTVPDAAHASFIETPIGLATLILSMPLKEHKEHIEAKKLIEHATSLIAQEDMIESDDGCEILYGRAGLLYALLYLKQESTLSRSSSSQKSSVVKDMEDLVSDTNIRKILDSIIWRGRCGAAFYHKDLGSNEKITCPPLMWSWHRKRYLGGAHGISGILQVILKCPTKLLSEYIDDILGTIEWLLRCQDPDGNWPTKAPNDEFDEIGTSELLQWCHGAPGMIILLSTVLRMTRSGALSINKTLNENISQSLRHASNLVSRHGLLKKGVGLCHGIAGSVFALLSASDLLDSPDNQTYMTAAAHLAQLATYHEQFEKSGQMRIPDRPWSLYEGMAGMCCAWAEVLRRLDVPGERACSGMPGFDDIGIQ